MASTLTASQLQAFADNIVTARAGGLRRVIDGSGETVEFKSDAEMANALASVRRQLAATGAQPVTAIRFNRNWKGLDRC